MKLFSIIFAALMVTFSSLAQAAEGLVTVKSPHSVVATMDRFEALAKQRGLTVFARIDHAVGAAKIGKTLRPTQVIIFGNPQGGTPFMECAQTVGIDLPLKVLVWEDASAQVWLGYNDPEYLARRHGVEHCPAVENLRKALAGLAESVVAP
ncbi:camphor resistance protein CrcB [mine drainage metagenome]|uniref:Camphor resistance protein CrcB n=1 Tax=mine drainage metagenome TaxID=410659 RepID=A0A1J5S1W8_9ZZZZ